MYKLADAIELCNYVETLYKKMEDLSVFIQWCCLNRQTSAIVRIDSRDPTCEDTVESHEENKTVWYAVPQVTVVADYVNSELCLAGYEVAKKDDENGSTLSFVLNKQTPRIQEGYVLGKDWTPQLEKAHT